MKKIKIIFLIFMMSSCIATVQSNKSKDFNQKIKKFYAVIKVADNTGKFVPRFSEALTEGLKLKGVEIEFEKGNPLALETEQEFINRFRESGADALLIVKQTEAVTYKHSNSFSMGSSQSDQGTFDVKIFISDSPKPVWRGLMKATSSGYGNISSAAKTTADTLIEKFIEDGIVDGF